MPRIRLISLFSAALALSVGLSSQAASNGPSVYIAPSGGFEVNIAAAIQKKHVPVQVVTEEAEATYVLRAAPVEIHKESGGSKLVRCLFAYCYGIEDSGDVSVQLQERSSQRVAWAYQVSKQMAAHNRQSMAEAIAKHMKKEFFRKSS